MTLLQRLRRPAPPSPKTLEDKIADLQMQSAEFVAGTALTGDEQALRIAAIKQLGAGDALFKVADSDEATDTVVQLAAQQRIAQLIDSGALDFANFCRRTPDIATVLAVAAFCSDSTRLSQAIAAIDNNELLSKLAVEGASTKVRQYAADAIQDPAQLKSLLKEVRGKDKNVYKIIKGKCDQLLALDKAAAETQANIATLCAALERQPHQPFDNLFTPTLEHLSTQWSAVAAQALPEIKARTEQAIDRCRDIITHHIQLAASQASRAAAIANADADRQAILNELRGVLASIYASESGSSISPSISVFVDRWIQLTDYKRPSAADTAQFNRLCAAVTELIELIGTYGTPLKQAECFRDATAEADLSAQSAILKRTLAATALLDDAVPSFVTEAATLAKAWEQSRQDKQAAESNALRQVGGLIRKASGALSDGKTGQTAGMRRVIEEKLHALPNVPAYVSNQLQQLDEKLSELQDWKSYAVAPKRIELIEQMEALVGSKDAPNVVAEHIKRLQDEWKAISKGSVDNADAEWQRFHQAAQTAYQPCRDYFIAQAKLRENNLDKRKALLTRLSDFAAAQNAEQTDWREVARALRESKLQWRSHQPVERAANKPWQEKFDALTNDLESRLEAESAKNADAKKSLITRAQALLGSDDGRHASDEVKRLQLAWKNVGIVARDDDQKLWAEFRQHCDAVFAKRQQQHGEYVTALDENKNRAVVLCVEAEQLLTLSGPALLEGAKKISALREIFDAIGELPKPSARDLQNRLERALEQCEQAITQQRARDKAKAWDNLLEAGDKIRLLRFASLTNASEDERAALKQAAQLFIDAVQHWPKSGLQAAKGELAKVGSTDIAGNEAALRTLCIRAEILTDTPTPPADHTFRRNYQVQRLMQGMGQARPSTKDELDAMVFEWIAVGATNNVVYAELLARFSRCRDQHQKQ